MRAAGWIAALATAMTACTLRAATVYWTIDGEAGDSFAEAYMQTLEIADNNAENVVAWLYSLDTSSGERIDYEPAVGIESEAGAGLIFYGESNPTAIPADPALVYGVQLGVLEEDGSVTASTGTVYLDQIVASYNGIADETPPEVTIASVTGLVPHTETGNALKSRKSAWRCSLVMEFTFVSGAMPDSFIRTGIIAFPARSPRAFAKSRFMYFSKSRKSLASSFFSSSAGFKSISKRYLHSPKRRICALAESTKGPLTPKCVNSISPCS